METQNQQSEALKRGKTERFDDLPEDILLSIVSCLGPRHAVRASLVSKRWRDLYASQSNILVTCETMFSDFALKANDPWQYHAKHYCPEYKDRFIRSVNQYLDCHDKEYLRLDKFVVGFCLDSECSSDIDRWVRFTLCHGVGNLQLIFDCGKGKHESGYIVRSKLLNSHPPKKTNNNLHTLSLILCRLEQGVIRNYFGTLKFLQLGRMYTNQEEFDSIVDCCGSTLVTLSLVGCNIVPPKLLFSFPALKFLEIINTLVSEEIDLLCENLIAFEYSIPKGENLVKIKFSGAPNLKNIYHREQDGEGARYIFTQLANDVPLLKNLSIHTESNYLLNKCISKEKMIVFCNVKKLNLFCHHDTAINILTLVHVLRSFPLLETLYVSVKSGINSKIFSEEFLGEHLTQVHIGGFEYCKSFINFAKYFLRCGVRLEKLIIDRKANFYKGAGILKCNDSPWHEGERQKVCDLFQQQGLFKTQVIIRP